MIDITCHPRLQTQLLGHQEVISHILTQFSNDKLHPAILLSGCKGIGKATLAYQVARKILASDQPFHQRLIDNNSHPNLLTIELGLNEDGKPQKEITVAEIRRLLDFCRQSPALPGWRVIIIDAVEQLNRHAANALLKVLEEPPLKTQFFLISHVYGRLLPTLRSRCLKISLAPLEANALPGENRLAAHLAQGSYGRYQWLMQEGVEKVAEQTLNLITYGINNQISAIQSTLKTFEKGDPRFELIPELVQWVLRRLLLLYHGIEQECLEQDPKIAQVGRGRDLSHWLKCYQACQTFLNLSQGSHLDANHTLVALFMILAKPSLVDELIYDT
jgi:DNA polymerase III subunit delta'